MQPGRGSQAPCASRSSEDWRGASPAGPARGHGLAPKPSSRRQSGGTPCFPPGRSCAVHAARAGWSGSPGGKALRPGLGTPSGLAEPEPSTGGHGVLSRCAPVPCSAWVRLWCLTRARRRPVRTSPRLLAAWLAGREYKPMARDLGRGIGCQNSLWRGWGCAQEQSRGLRAALALQASGLQAWHKRLPRPGQSPKHGMLTGPQDCPR